MPVKLRISKQRAAGVTDLTWEFLTDALREDDPRSKDPATKWRFYELFANRKLGTNEPIVDELWARFGADVLDAWIAERPGTRPSLWWRYDAPSRAPRQKGEAEAEYLDRHGLFAPGERERIPT